MTTKFKIQDRAFIEIHIFKNECSNLVPIARAYNGSVPSGELASGFTFTCNLAAIHVDIGSSVAVEDDPAVSGVGLDDPLEIICAFKDQIAVAALLDNALTRFISSKSNAVITG